jgi:hypothetical protein
VGSNPTLSANFAPSRLLVGEASGLQASRNALRASRFGTNPTIRHESHSVRQFRSLALARWRSEWASGITQCASRIANRLESPQLDSGSPRLVADDSATGNAIAGIARWLGRVVILAGVDHDRRAVAVQQRTGTGFKRDIRNQMFHRELRRDRYFDVRQIAGMRSFGKPCWCPDGAK